MKIDLHTHTNASDGVLSPRQLLCQADAAGVDVLAITDHDTFAAYDEISLGSANQPRLICGVEFSTVWNGVGVHVLGLNMDLAADAAREAERYQHAARVRRGEEIAERLQRAGVPNTLEGAALFAGRAAVGRPHFARHLVAAGAVRDISHAFRKYLGNGKIGDVKTHWASLLQIIEWIRDAGGTAVLAHPGKYGLTRTKRLLLVDAFQSLGGQGLELISGAQDPSLTKSLAETALASKLMVSCGSDFHQPNQTWAPLGMHFAIPAQCRPVWENW